MTVSAGRANRSTVSAEIIISDVEKLPKGTLTAKYNEAQNRWTLSGASLENDILAQILLRARLQHEYSWKAN